MPKCWINESLNILLIGFFHHSKPMIAQFAQLTKLVQLAQLAQVDKFFLATDRNFVAKSNILVCSNLAIFRNKITSFKK